MSLQHIMGLIAGILSLIATIPYIVSIFKGKTKPSRATWWIWSLVSFLILASYSSITDGIAVLWLPISYLFTQLTIAALSLKYGEGKITRLDLFCLSGAIIGAFIWWQYNAPTTALLINIFIDLLGAVPTIKKAYFRPDGENGPAWLLTFISAAINLFALSTYSFQEVIYPVYMLVANGAIAFLVYRLHKKIRLLNR